MSNAETRERLSSLIAEMTATTLALRAHGVEPGQREDREAYETIKRIIERAYQ